METSKFRMRTVHHPIQWQNYAILKFVVVTEARVTSIEIATLKTNEKIQDIGVTE